MNGLAERLRRWAVERPEAPALVHRGQVAHTWRSLQRAVGGVQQALTRRGVGVEGRVLLHLPAGPDWVVGCLGVWASGAAIVPIDPALPRARRQGLARRSGATAGLGLRSLDTVPVVTPDPPAEPGTAEVSSSQLAWLIFSSGSTGTPKGVLVTWGNVEAVLAAQVDALGLGPTDRCLWVLSPGFDASLSDVGVALWAGAALHTDGPGLLAQPDALRTTLREQRITYADLPPRYLELLDPDALPDLRAVLCGGEPLPPRGARRWAATRRLIGVYGPTEATICASLWRVDPDDVHRAHLGAPVAGARFREVDGELWIGGPGLARGYLADESTQARFVTEGGERWLRTGDAVRRDDDGRWLFVGRTDRQGKVDGRLVCPEEVEAALHRLPGVEGARVDVVTRAGVAVLEARVEGVGLQPEALQAGLAHRLPRWMIPRRVVVGRVPRGPTGKALPAAPADDDLLATTLAAVLGRPLGDDDSFATAGLDSVRAIDAAARLLARGLPLAPEQLRAADSLRSLRASVQPTTRPIAELVAEGRRLARSGAPVGRSDHGALLVTGATGSLGSHLLPRLVARGHPVVALVRAADEEAARDRLARVLRRRGVPEILDEVQVVAGSLPVLPPLPEVRAVVHLAAEVDLSRDLDGLRPSNVDGTRALLALGRPMLFASTLSVFVDSDAPRGRFGPTDPLPEAGLVGGYAQSKLVAEALVRASSTPCCAVRYGLLTPDRVHGHVPARDWLGLTLRGLGTLGCLPAGALSRGLQIDVTPVDAAAEVTASLVEALLAGAHPEVVHVCAPEPQSIDALLTALRTAVDVEVVDEATFLARGRRALAGSGSAEEAAAVLGLVRGLGEATLGVHRALDLFQATGCRFDPVPGIPIVDATYLARVVRRAFEGVR